MPERLEYRPNRGLNLPPDMASGALMAKTRAGGEGLNADSAVPCRRRPSSVEASQIMKIPEKKQCNGKNNGLRRQTPAV
jgi:hypothetical protein